MCRILNFISVCLVTVGCLAACAVDARQAGLIQIHGAIGTATASYISRAIDAAATRGDECLIIKLDTPGGLLESTKDIPMVAHERVFQLLWRPEVMFLLMLVAIHGIIGEISNPGAILPGVVGAIALILALYMSAILPVNIAGLALILLAVAMFIIDVYASTHGVLTVGGIIAFFLGSIMLFNRAPGFGLSLSVIIPATVLTAIFFIVVVGAGLRAQLLPARTGREGMLGKSAMAISDINSDGGRVFVEGESWSAVCDEPIPQGRPVKIISINGLTLRVKTQT